MNTEEPSDKIVINDMPGVYHVVYPNGWYIGHLLDPNEGDPFPHRVTNKEQ